MTLETIIATLKVEVSHLMSHTLAEFDITPATNSDAIHFYFTQAGSALVNAEKRHCYRLPPFTLLIISDETYCRQLMGSDIPARVTVGCIKATYGFTLDLFKSLAEPILETFDARDPVVSILSMVEHDFSSGQLGSAEAASTLMRYVLICMLRRGLKTPTSWNQLLAILIDTNIARVLIDMIDRPHAPHTILAMARRAEMSRTAFMLRFARVLGRSPMALLREIRVRKAASNLLVDPRSIEEIARSVGYSSRSSFIRAFQGIFGTAPSEYRKAMMTKISQEGQCAD